jgi:sirohydrochlorin cobaltochelatase
MPCGPASGLLLIGHGTKSQLGVEQFLWLAKRIGKRLQPLPVEPAFLELAEPTIDEAVGKLLARGSERLITTPLLLFAAGHAKDDVPSAVQDALTRRGKATLEQTQAAHFGCHAALLVLSHQRFDEALHDAGTDLQQMELEKTCHLLVGRGSRDDAATAEMHEFARLCSQSTGLATEVAFLAMASPSVVEQLRALPERGYRQIIVQPHLLFHGDLVDSLIRQVAQAKTAFPHIHWLTAKTLADPPQISGKATELLEAIILDRCRTAGLLV